MGLSFFRSVIIVTVVPMGLCSGFHSGGGPSPLPWSQWTPWSRLEATSSFSSVSSSSSSASPIVLTPYDSNRLFPPSVYRTLEEGSIAVVPNFLSEADVRPLRHDAQRLFSEHKFSTDALAGYGSSGHFDPARDRAVLKRSEWQDGRNGDVALRTQRLGTLLATVRRDLALSLNRPGLDAPQSQSVTRYGRGSTEVSYTRFGPGAFLKRHVDEHHEELKGRDGWSMPTRRSVSWLIYLNEPSWKASSDGGQLRCFQRVQRPHGRIGATTDGDLQIGWLTSTHKSGEIPVYLDAKTHHHGECAMYILEGDNDNNDNNNNNDINDNSMSSRRTYITKPFATHPILYVAGSERLVKTLLISSSEVAQRFRLIEPPQSQWDQFWKKDYRGEGEGPRHVVEEELRDVDPLGGTLVLFDSVSLPHEVLATRTKERWACSGWYHEDQQPVGSSLLT